MNDRTHHHLPSKVAAVIDNALAELLLLGAEGRDGAAKVMASLAITRIDEPGAIAEVADFAESFIERGDGDDRPS